MVEVTGTHSAATPVRRKATMAPDGTWLTIDVTRERVGQGEIERPADGSANLVEAVHRARAHEAYLKILRAL
jgi:hypothetical protein